MSTIQRSALTGDIVAAAGSGVTALSAAWQATINGKAPATHTHVIVDVTDLQAALDIKADKTGAAFTGTISAPNVTANGGTLMVDRTGDGTGAVALIRADAGFVRDIAFQTVGADRWRLRTDNAAESGANAGSPFQLIAYDDAGASLGNVFAITRASRILAFVVNPTAPTPAAADNSTKLATTAYVDAADATKETLGARRGINTQTGTTYTFVLADAGKLVEGNNAAAITHTVPPNSSVAYPVNSWIDVSQYGAGQITIAAGAGVTLRSGGGLLKTRLQYSGLTLLKRGTDEWYVFGDLA